MPIESGSDKTLKYVGQYQEGLRRAIVGMKGMGERRADADKLGSRRLQVQKAGECVGWTVRGRSGQQGIQRTRWIGEGGERKVERGERSQSLSQSFFVRTPPQALFFSLHPANPLPILLDPADEIRADRGIMGRTVADRGMWERVGRR